jgi:DNA-binding NarL/FixJ family response regulator
MYNSIILVMLVEDDAPIRERMAAALGDDDGLDLVGMAATLADARLLCARLRPMVLITDLMLPDGSGIDLNREVRANDPAAEIMVVSALGNDQSVLEAVEAGAGGYILKDATSLDLSNAVRELVAGHSPISSSIARTIVRRVQRSAAGTAAPAAPKLTAREMDILWGIAKGYTYNDLADALGISRNTVPTHIKNIYRKLEVKSRSEAVFVAIDRNMIKIGN